MSDALRATVIRDHFLRRKTLSAAIGLAFAITTSSNALASTYLVGNLSDHGPGSLRQAIADANGSNGGVIQFQASLQGTITLTTGEIAISAPMTIKGPGASLLTISGGGASRIFNAYTAAGSPPISITGLTLTNGYAAANGGAIYAKNGTLVLTDSIVTNSISNGSGAGLSVVDADNVTLTNDTFTANEGNYAGAFDLQLITQSTITGITVEGNTGTAGVGGGAISSGTNHIVNSQFVGNHGLALNLRSGTEYVTGCTFTNNTSAVQGSAISAQKVTSLAINNSSIVGNYSTGGGGSVSLLTATAVSIESSLIDSNQIKPGSIGSGGGIISSNLGTLTISYSTISHNSAENGGGISISGATTVTVSNSTIADNTASGQGGGIIVSGAKGSTGPLNLTFESDTIAGNYAYSSGGGIRANAGSITFHNSIIASNTVSSGTITPTPDFSGTATANYSLIGNSAGGKFNGTGNITNVDAKLGPLGDYGGGIPTMRPMTGSPAIDAGDPNPSTLTVDERELPRVVGAAIDMGAVEVQAVEDTIFLDGFESG